MTPGLLGGAQHGTPSTRPWLWLLCQSPRQGAPPSLLYCPATTMPLMMKRSPPLPRSPRLPRSWLREETSHGQSLQSPTAREEEEEQEEQEEEEDDDDDDGSVKVKEECLGDDFKEA